MSLLNQFKYIDPFNTSGKNNKPNGILTTDGVHLNDKGNNLVAEMVYENIFK